MFMNAKPSEQVAVVGVIDPDNQAAGTATTDYVDCQLFHRLMGIVFAGEFGLSATVDAKLVQATDSSGTGKKDITGYAITQLVDGDDDKQAVINLPVDILDTANNFTYVAMEITTATQAVDVAGVLLGFVPNDAPASDNDLASVDEIVG